MKLAIAAMLLFCTIPAATADAGNFGRFGRSRVNVNVGSSPISVNVQNRCGLIGRLRGNCGSRGVNINVGNGFHSGFNTVSSFQFVQPASFATFALPQPILNVGYGGYSGVSGYGADYDEDDFLNQRLREEIGELDQLKENIAALKDRLGL